MPENNEHVFFVDDDLIEKLMRGDAPGDSARNKRAAASPSLGKAVKLASEGKLNDAIKELERAAERGENPSEVYTGLGHLRFEQQNWAEAANCYSKAAAADPKHRSAHYNRGLCLERQEKFEDAAKAFEAALAFDPKRWQAQLGRGLCLLQLGKSAEALECFQNALKENPAHEQALFGKSVALHQLGRLDDAFEGYRKLLASQSNPAA